MTRDLTSTPNPLLTELPPLGMDAANLALDFRQYFNHTLGRDQHGTPPHCFYTALAMTLRDRLNGRPVARANRLNARLFTPFRPALQEPCAPPRALTSPGADGTDGRLMVPGLVPRMSSHELSQRLFARAVERIPGGVNSPVRAWRAVVGDPLFIQRARGSNIWDVYGNGYIDYVGSWGPMILGHAHPKVLRAVRDALRDGSSFGAPTAREVEMAEHLTAAIPSMDMVRLVSSGTEATMAAQTLAPRVILVGHIKDVLLEKAGDF